MNQIMLYCKRIALKDKETHMGQIGKKDRIIESVPVVIPVPTRPGMKPREPKREPSPAREPITTPTPTREPERVPA